jgi:kynurenine formamidase
MASQGEDAARQRIREFMAWVRELAATRRFGDHDRLGTANLLGPEARQRGAAAVRHGISLCLARPLVPHPGGGGRPGMALTTEFENMGRSIFGSDRVELACHGHVSTHIDALNHIGLDGTLYAGCSPDDHAALGIDGPARHGLITRGVVADIPGLRGTDWVTADDPVTGDELEGALRAANVDVQPGDALLVYMGRDRFEPTEGDLQSLVAAGGPAPGIGATGAEWIADQPISMLAWDFLDAVHPSQPALAVHWLLWAIGLLLVDNCDFSAAIPVLRERDAHVGLFTVTPTSLTGATGSNVTPFLVV